MLYAYKYEEILKDFITNYIDFIPKNEYDTILNYSKITLKKYIPKFNIEEFNIILNFIVYCLYFLKQGLNIEINPKFGNVSELDIFMMQISMNNDRNFLAIVNLIFPYIDDKNNSENQKNIKSIKDIIETKDDSINVDNKLKHCNYLYDHSLIRSFEKVFDREIKKLKVNIDDRFPTTSKLIKISDCYYEKIFYFIIDAINRVRYKFYINWTNSFPYNENNYKNSKLYKNSFKYEEITQDENNQIENFYYIINSQKVKLIWPNYFFNKEIIDKKFISENTNETLTNVENYINNSNTIAKYYRGINIEDIYNTLSSDYYHSIKNIRWLIFELKINNKLNLIITILNNILNLENIFNFKMWNLLDENSKSNFTKNYNNFINKTQTKAGLKNYSYQNLIKVYVYLLIYFDIHYPGTSKLKKDNLYNGIEFKVDEDDDLDRILKFDNDNIILYNRRGIERDRKNINDFIKSSNKIPAEHIYNFLYLEINKIYNTPYKYLLFDNNNLKDLEFSTEFTNKSIRESYLLTPKNYYNFSKSLIFKNNNMMSKKENKLYSRLWDGLSVEEKYIICIRLNESSYTQKWFKISNVLGRVYKKDDIFPITRAIYRNIRRQLIDVVFLNLIRKGCISKFEYNPEVSDVKIISDNFHKKKKMLDQNMKQYIFTNERKKEYKESYYYVNNKKYGDLDDINVYDDKLDISTPYNYIDYLGEILKTGDMWFTFYAIDWISQIDFYLKFLNQRVMYVTGATGQGKSTQVPKLYLYGLKSLLYKNNGKVICTVPRVGPVIENVTSISKSMGVPYQNYNEDYKKDMNTFNSNVQFKYADDSHSNINDNFYLRLVTDGTLIKQLQINPLLKKKKIIKKQSKVNPDIILSEENEYDIIMVDEAHEHNANMDLILTMMRHIMFYNNDIKLSIISATMEKDEPTFRKYYRMVDDNLTFPINMYNFNYCLDRNLIDRRYHISPPGVTTQFKVVEYYNNNKDDSYENNKKLAIDQVKKIFETTEDGDILLFSTTGNEIKKICEKLNKIIPYDCVAIPFFGTMTMKYKNIAKKIASKKKIIDISKKDIVRVFTGDIKEINAEKVQKGFYKRACIIATNVAEASLTIASLRYVVDIGFQLNVVYDYNLKFPNIVINKITEASRVQRKGRVGRVAGGFVYHMYPKGGRETVKEAYNISTSNFADSFTDLLTSSDDKNNEIIDVNILFKLISMRKLTLDELDIVLNNKNQKLIYDQYKFSDIYFQNNLLGFIEYVELNFLSESYFDYLFPTYYTGYNSNLLLDVSGHFYIVNPLETKIKRNIFTSNIVTIKNNSEIEKYIEEKDINMIYESSYRSLDIIKYMGTNKLYKSDLKMELNEISPLVGSYDKYYTKSFVISNIFDISEIFLFIQSILEQINYNIESLIDLPSSFYKKQKEINNFININNQNNSDLEYIYKIYNSLKDIINEEKLNNSIEFENLKLKDKLLYYLSQKDLNTNNLIKFCFDNNIDDDIYNDILKLFMKGDISLDGINEEKQINYSNIKDIVLKNDIIKKYCEINNLNYQNIVNGYIEYLAKITNYNIKLLIEEENENLDNLKKIINLSVPINVIDKIKYVYLYSNIDKLYYVKNNKFFNINNSLEMKYNNTLLSKNGLFGFFLLQNEFDNNININILTNITKKDLLEITPQLFYFNNIKDYISKKDLLNNLNYIQKKFNNFNLGEQKNVINNMYSEILSKLKVNQEGGNKFHVFTKINISTIKKFDNLVKLINKNILDKINDFDYGYIAIGFKDVYALHLIKEDFLGRYSMIYTAFDDFDTLPSLRRKMSNKGKRSIIYQENNQ